MGKKNEKQKEPDNIKEELPEEANAPETGETEEATQAEKAQAEETQTNEAQTEETSGAAGEEEGGEPQKKERTLGWAGKKAKKAEEEAQQKIAEANDKYARLFAEFDNFRKRSEKEKSQMFAMGARDVVEKILPVLDSIENGLAGLSDEQKEDPFVVGMDKVHKLFVQTLENMGVKPIEALGQEFNPEFHNAVMHVDDESVGENIVVEEFQKGYMYRDQVVRFSMVKVAN